MPRSSRTAGAQPLDIDWRSSTGSAKNAARGSAAGRDVDFRVDVRGAGMVTRPAVLGRRKAAGTCGSPGSPVAAPGVDGQRNAAPPPPDPRPEPLLSADRAVLFGLFEPTVPRLRRRRLSTRQYSRTINPGAPDRASMKRVEAQRSPDEDSLKAGGLLAAPRRVLVCQSLPIRVRRRCAREIEVMVAADRRECLERSWNARGTPGVTAEMTGWLRVAGRFIGCPCRCPWRAGSAP